MTAAHPSRALALALTALLFAVAVHVPVALGDSSSDEPRPLPSLTPGEVVRIQLEALRGNGADNRGIEVAFRFASPGNKRSTGPLPRFIRMIKDGPYALMLRFTDAEFAPVKVFGRDAAQRVTLTAPGEAPVTYVFYLSRQDEEGPLRDCWMTDGVAIVPSEGRQA